MYATLAKLMRAYETSGLEYLMSTEFYSLYSRFGRVYEKRYTLNLAEQLCRDDIMNAIGGWPRNLRGYLVEQVWHIAHMFLRKDSKLDADKLISAVAPALIDPALYLLHSKYEKDWNVTHGILEVVIAVAGHSGQADLALEVTKLLLELPEKEIESALHEIREEAAKVNWAELELAK